MAHKLPFIKNKVYRTFELLNNKLVDVYSVRYDSKVDLDNETFIFHCDKEYEKSLLPTFHDLVQQKIINEVSCVETYVINIVNGETLTYNDITSIIDEFKQAGFDVSRKAIEHNYFCWLGDLKSGYRGRDYHLFTPCGCNDLSFTATTLNPSCKEWQKTYEY